VPVLDGPLYVSVDLDGFDPAYAPGVSHHEPGGLSTRQVLDSSVALRLGEVVPMHPALAGIRRDAVA
jgi:arginase family enzyme